MGDKKQKRKKRNKVIARKKQKGTGFRKGWEAKGKCGANQGIAKPGRREKGKEPGGSVEEQYRYIGEQIDRKLEENSEMLLRELQGSIDGLISGKWEETEIKLSEKRQEDMASLFSAKLEEANGKLIQELWERTDGLICGKLDETDKKLEEVREELWEKEKELTKVRLECTALAEELETEKNNLPEEKGKCGEAQGDLEVVKLKLGKIRDILTGERKKGEAQAEELKEVRQELDAARQESDAVKRELDAARQDLDVARQESDAVRQESESSRQEAESLRQELNEAGQELKEARRELSGEKEEVQKIRGELENTGRKLEALEKELADEKRKRETQSAEAARIKEELDSRKEELQAQTQLREDTQKALREAESSLQTEREASGCVRRQLDNYESRFGSWEDITKDYRDIMGRMYRCTSLKGIVLKFALEADAEEADTLDNMVKFIGVIGTGSSFAQEVYNAMRSYKKTELQFLTEEERAFIAELNRYYRKVLHVEFDVLDIPEGGKFESSAMQDIDRPTAPYRNVAGVYVPGLREDGKTYRQKAIVQGERG